jgi:acyl-CoA dehydrogenase
MGFDDAPNGHAGITFSDVRVPRTNLLLGEGRGFEIAQGRLGPGRVHHCMRLIGVAERSLELMIARAKTRTAFGKTVADQGVVRQWIAESRCAIDQARLFVLKAAWMMDVAGNKTARKEIAMIKAIVPQMAIKVVDRAMQVHGGAGLSQDTPLSQFWIYARSLRLADGPDEVHLESIAKIELGK